MPTATERVLKGAAFLDQHGYKSPRLRNWRDKVDVGTLDIAGSLSCVLGQIFRDYAHGVNVLELSIAETEDYGFAGRTNIDDQELTEVWKYYLEKPVNKEDETTVTRYARKEDPLFVYEKRAEVDSKTGLWVILERVEDTQGRPLDGLVHVRIEEWQEDFEVYRPEPTWVEGQMYIGTHKTTRAERIFFGRKSQTMDNGKVYLWDALSGMYSSSHWSDQYDSFRVATDGRGVQYITK